MTHLQAIARYTVAESNKAQVLELLRELARHSREEPGNLAFDIYENVEDPTKIVLLERYVSREAFAAHRETPHFHGLVLGQIVSLLSDRAVEELDADET